MINLKTLDPNLNEKEITTYVQQQMVELSPHLDEQSALQVQLKKVDKGFEAELTATIGEGEIQTVGWNEDLYDAIRNAKEGLLEYFVEVQEEMNPKQRDEKLNYMARHGSLYLH